MYGTRTILVHRGAAQARRMRRALGPGPATQSSRALNSLSKQPLGLSDFIYFLSALMNGASSWTLMMDHAEHARNSFEGERKNAHDPPGISFICGRPELHCFADGVI